MHSSLVFALAAILTPAVSAADIPDDFPRFVVPGHEQEMDALRSLFHLHYQPPAGPLATMWDEWMTSPTLWPAVTTGNRMDALRQGWAHVLSTRYMDAEGYVATHQHPSIAHQHGWPFPFTRQGCDGAWDWHFALPPIDAAWHATQARTQEGWTVTDGKDLDIADQAWNIECTASGTTIETPPIVLEPVQSPFLQLRWRAKNLGNAQPFIEWTTSAQQGYGPDRRFYFPPITEKQGVVYTMIPMFKTPAWKDTVTRLRINFDNAGAGPQVGIQSLFTQYDTRHNINNPAYLRGCCHYFWWTRDLNFLRENINRMRLALRYAMTELGGREHKCLIAPWVGHCGRSGIERTADGKKIIHCGRGIGHDYWDLLPMGYEDAYATMRYYNVLGLMARLEREIAEHPEWDVPTGAIQLAWDELLNHADEVKTHAGQRFWNEQTGRFVCGIDIEGKSYDYGFTFINLDAIHYDFATPEQARAILDWINGKRRVDGDTSQASDIYHWRFGPRSTTLRNIDYYFWAWNAPESIPWGGQVQDGGAVLGWSYQDLMARLKIIGPDDAWQRLQEIIRWFQEVQAAGGYREYYKDGTRGTLQGAGTAGGLGCDREFFESILVPQLVIDGFLGFEPRWDGFAINPRLPRDWPELTVTRIHLHRHILDITVRNDTVLIANRGTSTEPLAVYLPASVGSVSAELLDADGRPLGEKSVSRVGSSSGPALTIAFDRGKVVRLTFTSRKENP